ncbi:hypothetical protein FAUST_10535 [Fusarium austroamericanum]|uniref:Uncharacterized protein n=1 Tax=Fusarium austroamericanum TaxID=282268 RepID=A0AAN5Z1E5_FUSAU|nr:hypothetical protein FAUST_10535 [Fusarium austroamericanum]
MGSVISKTVSKAGDNVHGSGGGSSAKDAAAPSVMIYKAGTSSPAIGAWQGINQGSYDINGSDTVLPTIPLEWIISPNGTIKLSCPSANATLGTFGATALLPVLILTVFGCRPIVSKLTCGIFGKKGGKGIYFTWLLGVSINLIGNYIYTLVVTSTEGYEHLRRSTVFALYASRPSFTMTIMALLRILVLRRSKEDGDGEYVYAESYISSVIGELSLQTIAAVFVGTTWKRFPNEPIKDYMGGSLIYMEIVPAITLVCLIVVPFWHRNSQVRAACDRVGYAIIAALFFTTVITASWVYWTKFLHLPGSL